MKVREILDGQEYDTAHVIWIRGTTKGHTTRDRVISRDLALGAQVEPRFPGSEPWALTADHDGYVPCELVAP